jgi:hypothetical protein
MNKTVRDLKTKYRVDEEGIIQTGKYSGELYFVPYFWEGRTPDEENDQEKTFKLTQKEQLLFPELTDIEELKLEETNGFVTSVVR